MAREKDQLGNILEHYYNLSSQEDKLEYLVETLNKAYNEKDEELIEEISLFVIGDEIPNNTLPAGFRMNALEYLTNATFNRVREADEDSFSEKFYEFDLCLWKYKWIIPVLPNDLRLSMEDIDFYSNQMKEYYELVKYSLSAVHKSLMLQAMEMGDVQKAKENFQLWQSIEADESADCEACEVAELVNYHYFIGEYEKVLELAKPILSGKLSCAEVPHIIYASVLNSLIYLGKWDDAKTLLPKAVKKITEDPDLIYLLGKIISCAVKLGLYDEAQELNAKYGEAILDAATSQPIEVLYYVMAMSKFDPNKLETAQRVCQAFDERNGNTYYADLLVDVLSKRQIH